MGVEITYFVHGTTVDNERGALTGWEQGVLSALGRQQAADLSNQIDASDLSVIYSSDLQRAVDSAHLAFGATHRIVRDSRIREADYGDLSGSPANELRPRLKDFIDRPFPNGESYKDIERRVSGFVLYVAGVHRGEHIGVMSHQAPQLALEVLLNGKTWSEAIETDWRTTKSWQPGWLYTLRD